MKWMPHVGTYEGSKTVKRTVQHLEASQSKRRYIYGNQLAEEKWWGKGECKTQKRKWKTDKRWTSCAAVRLKQTKKENWLNTSTRKESNTPLSQTLQVVMQGMELFFPSLQERLTKLLLWRPGDMACGTLFRWANRSSGQAAVRGRETTAPDPDQSRLTVTPAKALRSPRCLYWVIQAFPVK